MITLGKGARIKSKRHDVIWTILLVDSKSKLLKISNTAGKIRDLTFDAFSKGWEMVSTDSQV